MIAILTPPYPDELFYSYINRLSKINGIPRERNFIGRIMGNINDSTEISHFFMNYDGRGIFPLFFNSTNINAYNIINSCSVYPFQSIFLTPNRQAMVVDTLFNTSLRQKICFRLISRLKYCKECTEEDMKNYGYSYAHRAHQLPGVTVCHKHHTPLWDGDTPIEITTDAVEYAIFTKDLLDAGLQTNIDKIQQSLLPHIDKLTTKQKDFINKGLFLTKYDKIPEIVRILMNVFGSVDKMASCLSVNDEIIHKFIDNAIKEYDVYEPFNSTIIRLRHKSCGTTYFTTPFGFLAGWKCPSCLQKSETTKKSFVEMVKDLVGDEYTVVGNYIKRNDLIEIRHNKCGHIQNYRPKHFLDGSRCTHCRIIHDTKLFPNMVEYMTTGQYRITRSGTNIYEITEKSGAVIEVSIRRFFTRNFTPNAK